MKRSATEVIRSLEMRVARLESKGRERSMKVSFHTRDISISDLADGISDHLSKLVQYRVPKQDIEDELHDFFVDYDELINWEEDMNESVYDLSFDVQKLNSKRDNTVEVECVVEGVKKITFQVILGRRGVEVKEV